MLSHLVEDIRGNIAKQVASHKALQRQMIFTLLGNVFLKSNLIEDLSLYKSSIV